MKFNFDDWGKADMLVTGATGVALSGAMTTSQWADMGGVREGVAFVNLRTCPTGISWNLHTTYATGTSGVSDATDVWSSDKYSTTADDMTFYEVNDLKRYVRAEYQGGTGSSGHCSLAIGIVGWHGHDAPVN